MNSKGAKAQPEGGIANRKLFSKWRDFYCETHIKNKGATCLEKV